MLNKSLLELLKEEDRLVYNAKFNSETYEMLKIEEKKWKVSIWIQRENGKVKTWTFRLQKRNCTVSGILRSVSKRR